VGPCVILFLVAIDELGHHSLLSRRELPEVGPISGEGCYQRGRGVPASGTGGTSVWEGLHGKGGSRGRGSTARKARGGGAPPPLGRRCAGVGEGHRGRRKPAGRGTTGMEEACGRCQDKMRCRRESDVLRERGKQRKKNR